ncbi:MAG: hypothetical protein U9P61_02465 [Patescibacteria group bacterium]|nr:hypothetical protein [Patescibacteria group bacterium]
MKKSTIIALIDVSLLAILVGLLYLLAQWQLNEESLRIIWQLIKIAFFVASFLVGICLFKFFKSFFSKREEEKKE